MQRIAICNRAGAKIGISLIELLVTLATGVILLSIGIPSFRSLAASNQQTSEINSFISHLNLARSSAIKTGRNHVLCPSLDLTWCLDDYRWQEGYILFVDDNENELHDPQEPIVRANRPMGKIGFGMHSTSGRRKIIYRPDGRSEGTNLTLTFCDPEDKIPPRAIIVDNSGRVRISDTRGDGSPLSCGDG